MRKVELSVVTQCLRHTGDGDLFNRKQGSIVHSFSSSPMQRPDMSEILFKMTKNRKQSIQRDEYDLLGAQLLKRRSQFGRDSRQRK